MIILHVAFLHNAIIKLSMISEMIDKDECSEKAVPVEKI